MNPKQNFCKAILAVSISLFLISCISSFTMPMTTGEKWLYSKKENPEINISGKWVSQEWGKATFKQENRDVKGSLGEYPVKGVVSGTTVYLLMYWGEKVYFTAELKVSDNNTLKGVYVKYAIIDEVQENDRRYSIKPIILEPL